MTNEQIARLLRHVAAAYSIKDEKKYRFQIIAYQKAADSIESQTTQASDLHKEGKLDDLPGVGPSILSYLTELFQTGEVKHFDTILSAVPASVFPLLDIPTFGPKKAFKLTTTLKLHDPKTVIEGIYTAAKEGKIASIESFGEKSQADIIRAIDEFKQGTNKTSRMLLPYAYELAEKIVDYIKQHKQVVDVHTLGSLRRMKPTVGDIDLAVASHHPQEVIDHFVSYPYKDRIIEKGDVTASILISGGKHVDLLVLPPDQFGSMLQHFTGSKDHNVALREYSLTKGLSLSERGVKSKNDNTLKTYNTEEKFYHALGLSYVEPELRENRGEIEKALKKDLPTLITLSDIKGDLHNHSNYPIEPSHDLGADSMQSMIKRAIELGYEYYGFSEHNPSVMNHTKDQVYSILSKRYEKIEQLKESNKSIRIINLLELDILASGELAMDEKAFEYVDAVLVSIHSSFSMNREDMTKRILSGLAHPKAKIFSHPTGRLLNKRNGYSADFDKIFDFVKTHNKALEINAWPERLDLPDELVFDGRKKGVKFIIDTDSHALSHMDNMRFGVSVARRGWCEKKDVLNTLPAKDFVSWITS